MPIRGGWFIKDRVFIAQLTGNVTDEEYDGASNNPHVIELMEASDADLLHFIFEAVGDDFKPPKVKAGHKSIIDAHPKNGWAILVNLTRNPIVRMVASMMAQMGVSKKHYFTDSTDKALAYLRKIDPTLPETPDAEIEWMHFFGCDPDDLALWGEPEHEPELML